MTVNIYTITDAKSPKRQSARVIFILETMTSRGKADGTWIKEIEATANEAALMAVIMALEHITADCELEIFTESHFVASGIGWMPGWRENGWKTAKGKDVAHKDEWQQLDKLLEGHKVHIHCREEHSFRKWMQTEMRKRGKRNV